MSEYVTTSNYIGHDHT